jgi:hypothetical protein
MEPPLLEVPCEDLVGAMLHEGLVGVMLLDSVREAVTIVLRNKASLTGDASVIPDTKV